MHLIGDKTEAQESDLPLLLSSLGSIANHSDSTSSYFHHDFPSMVNEICTQKGNGERIC